MYHNIKKMLKISPPGFVDVQVYIWTFLSVIQLSGIHPKPKISKEDSSKKIAQMLYIDVGLKYKQTISFYDCPFDIKVSMWVNAAEICYDFSPINRFCAVSIVWDESRCFISLN